MENGRIIAYSKHEYSFFLLFRIANNILFKKLLNNNIDIISIIRNINLNKLIILYK